jgi:hypothetical protein
VNVCMNIDEAHFLGVLCVVMALEKNKFSSAFLWNGKEGGGGGLSWRRRGMFCMEKW